MIPTVVTRAVVAEEVRAALAWAAHRPGWTVEYDDDALCLTVRTSHPADATLLVIQADLHSYRAVPPTWRFVNPGTGETAGAPFPQPGSRPLIPGSIFHGNRVICAPWNRLAFSEQGGPHGDWGALTNWTDAAVGYTKADTLADMLSQIDLHLAASPGIMP